ncbi:MAG: hypothetical protein ABIB97_03405 [Patescibacteria group bacterium]
MAPTAAGFGGPLVPGGPSGPMNPYDSGPVFHQADQFDCHVDVFGNVGVMGRDTAYMETPNFIVEDTFVGSFMQGSQAFDDTRDLEIMGPGARLTSITPL